jgi:hypothetical protein
VKWVVALAALTLVVAGATRAGAGQLGPTIPANCIAHTTFTDGPDLEGDYRCAGIAIEYHTAGAAYSPDPIWAGQWLFTDESHQFRVGTCVFNRGLHPTIAVSSTIVEQSFPNDPTGAKSAYLAFRYGDSTDDLTAAGLWAVMHYYAQDAAGARRAVEPDMPLVPSLDMVARASGREDIESMAIALDAEATRLAGTWSLAVTADVTGHVEAHLTAGDQPVAGVPMAFLVSGRDDPVQVTTDVDGVATADVAIQAGTMTVAASAPAPGPAVVYRGTPAGPDPQGAQRLVTGGTPIVASATATVEVPPDTTPTTSTTTTTDAATTTTELASTSTSSTTSTAELATTAVAETTPTTVPVETTPVVPVVAVHPPRSPLPKTGRRTDGIAYLATGLLVAGIGIVGAVSRRPRKAGAYTP